MKKRIARIIPVLTGEYDSSKNYDKLDRVLLNGTLYECIGDDVQTPPPDTTKWAQISFDKSVVDNINKQLSDLHTNTTTQNTNLTSIKASTDSNTKSIKALSAAVTQSANGLMLAADKKKLDGIQAGAQANPGAATQSANGLMSAADKKKLDGIAAGANVNTNWTTRLLVGDNKNFANAATGNGATYLKVFDNNTLRDAKLIKGAGSTTVTSDANGNITINSANTTYGAATQSANGLMSAADKKKLDGIAAGAGVNTDTHWTTHLYVGASNGATNAATGNGATYLMVLDNSTVRDRRLIKGAGTTTVTSDQYGSITITSTDFSGSIKNVTTDVTNKYNALNTNIGKRIAMDGARGALAGYETPAVLNGSQTINMSSNDSIFINASGATTLTFQAAAANITAVKAVTVYAKAASTLAIKGAVWANKGSAPTWGAAGKTIVIIAYFTGGRVVLSVLDNNQ